ncbi:17.6 kDa class I heat shock protein 1-like [Camellia sinensis]|uniref:17.6 kDa class I heat shock protein 1-like n=1 Tax=Camellia sinensis TaxID=4442 RepID=UPI0010364584|nr:17.6 kDa class I heat shock protein 1-like [Camellia sinensis]
MLPPDDPFYILEETPLSFPKSIETLALARCDWKEIPISHVITLDVPGLTKEDIKITVEKNRVLRLVPESLVYKRYMYSQQIFQQRLAKREGGTTDRSQDIAHLQEFYKHYREKHNIDKLREEKIQLRESGAFSGNHTEKIML